MLCLSDDTNSVHCCWNHRCCESFVSFCWIRIPKLTVRIYKNLCISKDFFFILKNAITAELKYLCVLKKNLCTVRQRRSSPFLSNKRDSFHVVKLSSESIACVSNIQILSVRSQVALQVLTALFRGSKIYIVLYFEQSVIFFIFCPTSSVSSQAYLLKHFWN